jgi:hypothetical protein
MKEKIQEELSMLDKQGDASDQRSLTQLSIAKALWTIALLLSEHSVEGLVWADYLNRKVS